MSNCAYRFRAQNYNICNQAVVISVDLYSDFQMPGVCTEMVQIASTSVIVCITQNVAEHVIVGVTQLP